VLHHRQGGRKRGDFHYIEGKASGILLRRGRGKGEYDTDDLKRRKRRPGLFDLNKKVTVFSPS